MTTRRRLLTPLVLILGSGLSLRAQAPAQQPTTTNDGAWALWDEVMHHFLNSYYQPLDEAQVTKKTIELLADKVQGASSMKPSSLGTTHEDLQLGFREFILKLTALSGKPAGTFVEAAIASYCEQLKFTRYLPAKVNAALGQLGEARVDMSIKALDAGRFVCLPEPGGNAAEKGIRAGDELISIDGVSVQGKSGFQLQPRLHGSVGSQVEISVRQISGRTLAATLTRSIYSTTKVTRQSDPSGPRIRIPGFSSSTANDLRALLKDVKATDILTLDLRGNGGGDIRFATEAIGLLAPGARPFQFGLKKQRGQPDVTLSTEEPCICAARSLIILQDEGTASSAELLIAALQSAPDLRVSIGGTKSHGKDVFEATFDVSGGLFIITVGNLTRMDGTGWAEGIKPTFYRG